ncbi:MMPL family transporter [Aeromicrobium sp. YIM 150415]|uniref:MMPL family transporter n=1 Tax=Aeromicrobium sp. YIM 150415 TaxID=2803912 RepID=UPI001965343F|nr:MMPL family transporter [Aeromicrobium sp. YIM 150415]MBM9464492.1 MMPL family transporter [Aeromicrobium sp. YIM 150415]
MSAALYSLGRWCHRHAGRVVAGWLVVLAAAAGLAATVGEGTHDDFTLPGTEGQEALDTLTRTFPQIAGISAQIVYIAPEGSRVDDPALREAADATLERLDQMPLVDDALSPFDDLVDGTVNAAGDAAIIQVQFSGGPSDITDQVKTDLRTATEPLEAAGAEVELGGGAFMNTGPTITWMEAAGVVVAFVVLWIALGSGRAAFMPVLTALIGVGVTMSLIWALTAVTHLASPTPLLALMIGLAVGIDYALFIVSRQREELGRGAEPDEASGRAVATGGSAVVFAGITTLIALAGLAIARIPFLTWMGVTASASVAIAVVVAITLLPALMGLAGERLRPRSAGSGRAPIARRWVRAVTTAPWVTVVVVVLALGALALPGRDLALALPGNGTAEEGTTERAAYDLVDEHFGPGFNSPILLTADIIDSLDPVGLMDRLGEEVAAFEGVETVALATPNPTADTGVVQFFPSTAADDPATAELVERLREAAPRFERDYDVTTAVTGQTAMEIDVSEQLSGTLLPFGAFVVVLTLLLLTTVFRSVVVPVKAALGYLLSVGVSFGAVVLVFQRGWAADLLGVDHIGPVISFLPILLMGVLFGLAMDYELFLVSRMKEEFARDGDADRAIEAGFATSGRVVTAAAVVMLAVFIAFVPESDAMVKPIAFALAIGVFVDAFVVRMILVPAVMKLLGSRAWWIPSSLDRSLPRLDVEGEALHERVARADWPADGSRVAIASLTLPSGHVIDSWRTPDSCVVVEGSSRDRAFVALTLSGRAPQATGTVRVDDLVLPFDASRLRRRSALLPAGDVSRRRSVGAWMAELGSSDPEALLTEVATSLAARGLGPVPNLADRAVDLSPPIRIVLAVAASTAHVMIVDLADLGEYHALRVVDACHDLLTPDRLLVATAAPGALSGAEVATLSLDPIPELMTV